MNYKEAWIKSQKLEQTSGIMYSIVPTPYSEDDEQQYKVEKVTFNDPAAHGQDIIFNLGGLVKKEED